MENCGRKLGESLFEEGFRLGGEEVQQENGSVSDNVLLLALEEHRDSLHQEFSFEARDQEGRGGGLAREVDQAVSSLALHVDAPGSGHAHEHLAGESAVFGQAVGQDGHRQKDVAFDGCLLDNVGAQARQNAAVDVAKGDGATPAPLKFDDDLVRGGVFVQANLELALPSNPIDNAFE